LKYLYRFLLLCLILAAVNNNSGAAENMSIYHQTSGQSLIEAIRIAGPLSFCNEQVPLKDDAVKERFERELLISLDNSDDIILWLKRANRYFPHIEKVLKDHSMPDDLKYIAIAESSLKPHARSDKGATGYWQFIENTAIKYGLIVNNDIDERRNFYASTEAALNYLQDLYALFGSWTLAAAAYNMGEEGLKAEMLVQKVSNYYELDLYQETQRYIFRILAAKLIISNPNKYGYSLSKNDLYKPVQFDYVDISTNQPVPLSVIAQAGKTYFKVIKDLNPQLKSYYLPTGKYKLMVPQGAAMGFSERYENLLSKWILEKNEQIYIVKTGDNLSLIAERFNVPVKAIMIWNGITNGKKVLPGEKLIIFSDRLKKEISNPANNANKEENLITDN
jgi:membrane-bound lytic murein transglycosylase D